MCAAVRFPRSVRKSYMLGQLPFSFLSPHTSTSSHRFLLVPRQQRHFVRPTSFVPGLVYVFLTLQEELPGVWVRGHALQQRQCVAHSIGRVCSERGWAEHGIDGDDFLQECTDGPEAVPQARRQFREALPFLAQIQEGVFPRRRIAQFQHQVLHLRIHGTT